MNEHSDVIIIGAGVASLAAAAWLCEAGLSITILEARDRIGGRILTIRDSHNGVVELGAEFIHGRPLEVLDVFASAGVHVTEVEGDAWCQNGKLHICDYFSQVQSLLGQMSDKRPDESFQQFLNRISVAGSPAQVAEAKRRTLSYVSGFNAANAERVGVHWLVKTMRAEESIEGDGAFRAPGGYETLLQIFRHRLERGNVTIRTGAVVTKVSWRQGAVVSFLRNQVPGQLRSKCALVTIPLGVMKSEPGSAGYVHFDPELPDAKKSALQLMEMGRVMRMTFRFRHRFWETIVPEGLLQQSLKDMSFLFTQDVDFPTWWTTMPQTSPVITAWIPPESAERLFGKDEPALVTQALGALSRALGVSKPRLQSELESVHWHDWIADPFSRGAYSYGAVGASGAQEALGRPESSTLFFAGEATDTTGHNGTVHGAIASGYRTAKQILNS